MTNEQRTQRLMTTFGFTKQALEVHRSGDLLGSEKAYWKELINYQKASLLVVLSLSTLMLITLIFFMSASGKLVRTTDAKLGIVFIFLLLLLWCGAYFYEKHRFIRQKPFIIEGVAICKEIIRYDDLGEREPSFFTVLIGGVKFVFHSEDTMNAFVAGTNYRVYYLPFLKKKTLLSAEAI